VPKRLTDPRERLIEGGLLTDLHIRDAQGRIWLRYGEPLEPGDKLFVCAEDGNPELEVNVEVGPDGRRWGRTTGRFQDCIVGRRRRPKANGQPG
jgi:hypothetical protein